MRNEASRVALGKALREGTILLAESIEVPWYLFQGYDDTNARRTAIIAPAWDRAADDLRRFGHAGMETLTHKLEERATELREQAQLSKAAMIFHRYVLRAFQTSAAQHGQDALVIDSVYSASDGYLNEWMGGGLVGHEEAAPFWVAFTPDPHALAQAGVPKEADLDALSEGYEFEARHTWKDAVERAAAGLDEYRERYRQMARTIAAVTFRLSILRNVLWQYECFGEVASWSELNEEEHFRPEDRHHDRTLTIGSTLLDYHEQHGAYPENGFEGSKMNFYEWAAQQIDTSSAVVILALKTTGCLKRGTQGRRGDELIPTLEATMDYARRHRPDDF